MRAESLLKLLNSVEVQTLYPDEILIIDGSPNEETKQIIEQNPYKNLKYFLVDPDNRGLTKQRNFGIKKVSEKVKIVCFLDDDTILDPDYFKLLINTYEEEKDAVAVGGYITNDTDWYHKKADINFEEFSLDGFTRKLGKRYTIRKKLRLEPNVPPGFVPSFSHGYPISFLPPSGTIYQVESFMGCSMSFNKSVFDKESFSIFFESYGLYEDLDFCLRVYQLGRLYVNTKAKLEHNHDVSGRPNQFNYGKMVLRNGWYVWRVKYPSPNLKTRLKWNATAFLLTIIRFTNVFNRNPKKSSEAFTETIGRIVGWFSLIFNKPNVEP